jgi:hypothetical protein
MRTWVTFKIKCNILFRKHLLNLLLLFFSPSNRFIIALSQNLDKHIVLYQKILFLQHNSKSIKEIAA